MKLIKKVCLSLLITSLSVVTYTAQKEAFSTEWMFTDIYNRAAWWTGETYSGIGSNLHPTQLIRKAIPNIIKQFQITSLLDIPCGDFHWMKEVSLEIPYIGADIVKDLVMKNQLRYQNTARIFMHLDIITDKLPTVDLIFCRDCLVHLSNQQIWQALQNIKCSGSKYLLTTIYTETKYNKDISPGDWRPLNLMFAPFNLENPILIINEGYEADKSLGIWKISELNV